jgi:putative transposase
MPWKEKDVMNLRSEFVLRALKEENFRALCREYGISPKTEYKWLDRFKEDGLSGRSDASRRPHRPGRQLGEDILCEILRLKKLTPHWGPKKIRAVYARRHTPVPSESTFKRVLDKAGWVEHRRTPARKCRTALHLAQSGKAERHLDGGLQGLVVRRRRKPL